MRRLILLDRDGTIIVNKHYLKDSEGVELIPGAAEGIKRLNEAGHVVAVISNQSGVARGMMTVQDVGRVMGAMLAHLMMEGASIDQIYTCPEVDDAAPCRKPNTGMLEQASNEFDLPLTDAVVVGDNAPDILAGKRAGCRTVLVQTGKAEDFAAASQAKPDVIVNTLIEAAVWIVGLG